MHYALIEKCDMSNGPGLRTSLFVSGCRNRCKGCFNKIAWDFNFGEIYSKETENEILVFLKPEYIAGITILGGEPFEPENRNELICLLKRIRLELPEKSIWIYTGYVYEKDIQSGRLGKSALELFGLADVLVDGPFMEKLKTTTLPFRGSKNQRLIDVTATLLSTKVVPAKLS